MKKPQLPIRRNACFAATVGRWKWLRFERNIIQVVDPVVSQANEFFGIRIWKFKFWVAKIK